MPSRRAVRSTASSNVGRIFFAVGGERDAIAQPLSWRLKGFLVLAPCTSSTLWKKKPRYETDGDSP